MKSISFLKPLHDQIWLWSNLRANKTELHLSHNVLLTLSIEILLYITVTSGISREAAGALFGAMLA